MPARKAVKGGMQPRWRPRRTRTLAAALLAIAVIAAWLPAELTADQGGGSSSSDGSPSDNGTPTSSGTPSSSGGSHGSSGTPGNNESDNGDGETYAANNRTSGQKYCANNMAGRVVWATATRGGRNCQAACRGFAGGSNKPYVALNVGTGSSPAFLCRATDPSFRKSKRAGCSYAQTGRATDCYGYANGGPKQTAGENYLAGGSMECGCVADRSRYAYSGCTAPVWKPHNVGAGTSCRTTCQAAGHRSAVEDTPGQGRFVCRPMPSKGSSTRIGWSAPQAGVGPSKSGIACHFVTQNAAVSGQNLSVYSFDFQCLCM